MRPRKRGWSITADANGERHIETFKRKKEADTYAQQIGVDIRAGTHTPVSKSITVAKAAEDWIAYAELEGRERATVATYRQHAKHIGDRIGNVKLASLTTPRINAFRDDLVASMSRAMARKVLVSLKSLLRDAQRRGNVAQNVALGVSIKGNPRGRAAAAGRCRYPDHGRSTGPHWPTAGAVAAVVPDRDIHRPARIGITRTTLAGRRS